MSFTPFSRHSNARVSDAFQYCGLQTVILENELVRIVILPEKGGEIFEFRYKQLDVDPLLHFRPLQKPARYPQSIPLADGAFSDFYDGGWQVMFPSGGGPNSALGTSFGRHGEAALLPWFWRIIKDEPEQVSVILWSEMVRTPFVYKRVLSLNSGESKLSIKDSVTNKGGVDLPFMWGHHPAFGAPFLDGSCVLDVPAMVVETSNDESPSSRVPPNINSKWPIVSDRQSENLDLRFIPEEGSHTSDMLFLSGLTEGWFALTNRNLGLGFGLTWDVDVFPVLWVWQEFGGTKDHPWYGNTYALGLEPCTNYVLEGSNGLAGVIEKNQARVLRAGETLSITLQAVIYEAPGAEGVKAIDQDGKVDLK